MHTVHLCTHMYTQKNSVYHTHTCATCNVCMVHHIGLYTCNALMQYTQLLLIIVYQVNLHFQDQSFACVHACISTCFCSFHFCLLYLFSSFFVCTILVFALLIWVLSRSFLAGGSNHLKLRGRTLVHVYSTHGLFGPKVLFQQVVGQNLT